MREIEMKVDYRWTVLLVVLAVVACGGETAYEKPPAEAVEEEAAPEAAAVEPVAQMQADCSAAGEAMAARQAEASLYDRLGGREAIHTVTTDIVARHHENEAIAHLFETTDDAALIDAVTDFLSQAFGGDVEYHGKDMVTAHAGLELNDEYFLAAGGDVQAALEAAGVGADEIQEVMCAFASLHGDVVRQ